MSTYNYPQTVYLVDAKQQSDIMPLSLNLIGEANITRSVDGKKKSPRSSWLLKIHNGIILIL